MFHASLKGRNPFVKGNQNVNFLFLLPKKHIWIQQQNLHKLSDKERIVQERNGNIEATQTGI